MNDKLKSFGKIALVLLGFFINAFGPAYFLFNFPDPEIARNANVRLVEKTMPLPVKEFCTKIQNYIAETRISDLQKVAANPDDFKNLPELLPNVSKYIYEGGKYTILPMGYHRNNNNGDETFNAVFEYEFEKYAALLTITAIKKENGYLLHSLNWNTTDKTLAKTNKFDISKASSKGIFFIILMVAANLFAFFVWCLVVFDVGSAKRYLWLLGIPFGFSAIYFHWTTNTISFLGQTGVLSLGVNMPIGGITQMPGQSAILRISFPIFALIYLWLWNKKRKNKPIDESTVSKD